MPKSLSREHLGFVRAVLQDAADYYPMLSSGFERDLSRLESHAQSVGDRVFLIDLPNIGKALDKALDVGVLSHIGLPLSRAINTRTTVPRLFQGLWLLVFELDGCLKSSVDPQPIFFLRQLYLGQKKFRKECPPDVTYATVEEFVNVDQQLPPPSLLWDSSDPVAWVPNRHSVYDRLDDHGFLEGELSPFWDSAHLRPMLDTVQKVCDRIASGLGEFHPSLFNFRHGPGATSEYQRGAGYKYLFPSWSSRLRSIFPGEEFAIANTSLLGGGFATTYDLFGNPVRSSEVKEIAELIPDKEDHSRLIAVPKTQKAPRLIAAEPTCNQWTQQNVKNYLDERIRASPLGRSIDFRRQDLSREAARRSSVDVGSLATLDLSSASDRVSCWLIERAFRGNVSLLRALSATRTRYIHQNIDRKSPSLIKARKFSSMGSALTFPMQSLLFLMLVLGVGSHLTTGTAQSWKKLIGKCRIYGDDLIFPVEWVPSVVEVFEYLHLKVNRDKSFWNGKFRESCGLDAYAGHDVTPAYFLVIPNETALGSIATTVATANNFFLKGLWRTAAWVERLVPPGIRKLIPDVPIESVAFGFYTSSGFRTQGKTRWNEDLQRWEYRTLAAKASVSTQKHEGFANLLQYFTEDPTKSIQSEWSSGDYGKATSTISLKWFPVYSTRDTLPHDKNWSAGLRLPA